MPRRVRKVAQSMDWTSAFMPMERRICAVKGEMAEVGG
ncbi:Uncharacterised protein [Bordetella pertussis]|nr:Uncharacterised protein [Bordetella pertussis]